jgi:hypothetical protein
VSCSTLVTRNGDGISLWGCLTALLRYAQLPLFSRIPDADNLKARFTAALIRRMSSAYYLAGSLITRCELSG